MKLTRSLIVAALVVYSSPLLANDPLLNLSATRSAPVPNYGLTDESLIVVSADSFRPFKPSTTWDTSSLHDRYSTVATFPGNLFVSSVSLPNGSLITGLQLRGCDSSSTTDADLDVALFVIGADSNSTDVPIFGGTTGSTGCNVFRFDPSAPITVNNSLSTYSLGVFTKSGTIATRFSGVGVYYKLQVSPGPGSNTFGDVPTNHVFYKFIEALAAAGITVGCGGGNFCVNSPITRGEVAVWIAAALGLHHPN